LAIEITVTDCATPIEPGGHRARLVLLWLVLASGLALAALSFTSLALRFAVRSDESDFDHGAVGSAFSCRSAGLPPFGVARCRRIMGHQRPLAPLIDRVEAALTANPCIGDLGRWDRIYSFALDRRGGVDEGRIDFALREAGRFDFVPGRTITLPDAWSTNDDRHYRVALGTYEVGAGQVDMFACGNNVG